LLCAGSGCGGDFHRLAQRGAQFREALLRQRVSVGQLRVGIDDEVNLAGQVVHYRQFVG
jgi:hypothetical protein